MDAAINSISESQDEPCLYVSKSYRFVVRLSYKLLAIIKKQLFQIGFRINLLSFNEDSCIYNRPRRI